METYVSNHHHCFTHTLTQRLGLDWVGLDWIGIECGGMEFEGKGCERRKKQTICMLLKIHEHIYIQTEKDDEITKYLPPIM